MVRTETTCAAAADSGMQVLGVVAALGSRDALADAATEAKARALQQVRTRHSRQLSISTCARAFSQSALRLCPQEQVRRTMLVAEYWLRQGYARVSRLLLVTPTLSSPLKNAIRLDPQRSNPFAAPRGCGCFLQKPEVGRGAPVKSGMRFRHA